MKPSQFQPSSALVHLKDGKREQRLDVVFQVIVVRDVVAVVADELDEGAAHRLAYVLG